MGSVGALTSVNTIVAALLGHFLLGEALSRLHLLALLLAVGGAVIIWGAEAIRSTSDPEVLGSALALLAGCCSGCATIASRKVGKASSLMLGSGFNVGIRIPLTLKDVESIWQMTIETNTVLYFSRSTLYTIGFDFGVDQGRNPRFTFDLLFR